MINTGREPSWVDIKTCGALICNPTMDPVSAAASVTALVSIAASTIRITTEVIQRFYDAPEELQHLSRQLRLLKSELVFISSLDEATSKEDLALLPNETDNLKEVLQNTRGLMLEIQAQCNRDESKSKVHVRVSWVFHEKAKMQSLVFRLQDARTALQTILQVMNM